MNNSALNLAKAELGLGLASAEPTSIDTTVTDILSSKVDSLATTKQAKLNLLGGGPDLSGYEEVGIEGLVDADSPLMVGGQEMRESSTLGRYDAAEVQHKTSVLPSWVSEKLPTWMPGSTKDEKSDYAMDMQRLQAAELTGKHINDVTQKDVQAVGTMQQVQAMADLVRKPEDGERWIAPFNPDAEAIDSTKAFEGAGVTALVKKNPKLDPYNRPLTDVINPYTKENLTDAHALDPTMNAFAGRRLPTPTGVLEGTVGFAGDFAKSFMASGVKTAIVDPLDAVAEFTGLGDFGTAEEKAKAVDKFFGVERNVAEQQRMQDLGKRIVDPSRTFWEKAKDVVEITGDAMTSGNTMGDSFGTLAAWLAPTKVLRLLGLGAKGVVAGEAVDAAVAAGKMTKAQGLVEKAKLLGTADGLISAGVGQAGHASGAFGTINDQYEEFVKNNNGVELEGADKVQWGVKAFVTQMFNQNLDAITDISILKSPQLLKGLKDAVKAVPEKEYMKFLGAVGTTLGSTALKEMPKEAAQEYTQRMMELANERYGSAQFKDSEGFVKFVTDTRNMQEAVVDAVAGAGGAVQFKAASVIGGALDKGAGKSLQVIQKEMERRKEVAIPTDEGELTEVERKVVGTTLSSIKTQLETGVYDTAELTKAIRDVEPLVNRLDSKNPKHVQAMTDFEGFKAKLAETVEGMDLTKPIVFRNKDGEIDSDAAEDMLGYVISGKVNPTLEPKLVAIAKANGISDERYSRIRDAASVEYDATEGQRGYLTYARQISSILASDNPDDKALASVVNKARKFRDSQLVAIRAFENAIGAANKVVAMANGTDTTKGSGVVTDRKFKVDLPRSSWNIIIEGKAKGEYKVSARDLALLEVKRNNAKALNATLALVNDKVKRSGKTYDFVESGLFEIPEFAGTADSKIAKNRKMDINSFKKHGVTKVVLPSQATSTGKHKTKWAEYAVNPQNSKRINSGTYSSDDVVYVDLQGTQSTDMEAIKSQVEAAVKAGATIVMAQRYTKEGIKDVKQHDAIATDYELRKIFAIGKKYIRTIDSASGKSTNVFKPRSEELKASNAKAAAEAKVKREAEAVTKAADDKMVLDIAKGMVANESEEALITRVKVGHSGYVEANYKDRAATDSRAASNKWELAVSRGRNAINNQIKAAVKELKKEKLATLYADGEAISTLIKEKLTELGITSADIRTLAMQEIDDAYRKSIAKDDLLKTWKTALEDKNVSDTDLETILNADKSGADFAIVGLLKNNIGKGKKAVTQSVNDKGELRTSKEEGDRMRALDVNEVVEVQVDYRDTSPVAIFDVGYLGEDMNRLADEAVEKLTKLLIIPYTIGKDGTTNMDKMYKLANNPARALFIQEVDGKEVINRNAALAAALVMRDIALNDGYMLSGMPKSKEDLAKMLGTDEFNISNEARAELSTVGMPIKAYSDMAGKSFTSVMGLRRNKNTDVDAHAFEALRAGIGGIVALLHMQEKGVNLTRIDTKRYNKLRGEKDPTAVGDVLFIVDKSSKTSFAESVTYELGQEFKGIKGTLPNISTRRVEPRVVPLKEAELNKRATTIRKDKSMMDVAPKAGQVIRTLSSMSWRADLTAMRGIIENRAAVQKSLGYNDNEEELAKMTYNARDLQIVTNREITKSLDEIEMFVAQYGDDETEATVYYGWSYVKNGRYMLESNTINPQTDKLHRFLVQPQGHALRFTSSGDVISVETKDGTQKDVTHMVNLALAQAMAKKTDKNGRNTIDKWGREILETFVKDGKVDTVALAKAKQDVYTGKLTLNMTDKEGNVTAQEIEVDHMSHALQALDFIEKLANGGSFTSSLTIEFDALTSGFGNKVAQMGWLLDDAYKEHMLKVGIVLEEWVTAANDSAFIAKDGDYKSKEYVDYITETVKSRHPLYGMTAGTINALALYAKDISENGDYSIGNLLSKPGFLDSYQTLASEMENASKVTYGKLLGALNKDIEHKKTSAGALPNTETLQKLWVAIQNDDNLPKVKDGVIDSAMRNLFKYPFMIFNYAASIKTLRRNMNEELITTIIEGLVKSEGKDSNGKDTALFTALKTVFGNDLLKQLRETQLDKIVSGKMSLHETLFSMFEGSYGHEFEGVMTKKFAPFMKVQDLTNSAFEIMFAAYNSEYTARIAEMRKGNKAITFKQYAELVKDLRKKFPAIKGPLSEEELDSLEDNIAIYDEASVGMSGDLQGQYHNVVEINETALDGKIKQRSLNVQHKIKTFAAAIKAGSVVPYHFIDGAHLASVVDKFLKDEYGEDFDTSMIHDALLVALSTGDARALAYNEGMLDLHSSYSLLKAILKSLESSTENVDVTFEKGKDKISYADYRRATVDGLKANIDKVEAGVKKFYESAAEHGVIVGHTVVPNEGTFRGEYRSKTSNKPAKETKSKASKAPTKSKEDIISEINTAIGKAPVGLRTLLSAALVEAANTCKGK